MSLVIEILSVLIFILVYKVLDDQYSLLLYGTFMIYVTLNFNTYFVTGVTEAVWTPFVVVLGLLTGLIFIKMIWVISKVNESKKKKKEEAI